VQEGSRAIDLGCGPQGVLDLLSERVGATGHVTGVERNGESLATARRFVADRALQNVTLLRPAMPCELNRLRCGNRGGKTAATSLGWPLLRDDDRIEDVIWKSASKPLVSSSRSIVGISAPAGCANPGNLRPMCGRESLRLSWR
jgi:hypothetical protein